MTEQELKRLQADGIALSLVMLCYAFLPLPFPSFVRIIGMAFGLVGISFALYATDILNSMMVDYEITMAYRLNKIRVEKIVKGIPKPIVGERPQEGGVLDKLELKYN